VYVIFCPHLTTGARGLLSVKCLLTNAQRCFVDRLHIQFNNNVCFKLQLGLATCLSLSALRCIDCVGCVGGRCFALPLCRYFRHYR